MACLGLESQKNCIKMLLTAQAGTDWTIISQPIVDHVAQAQTIFYQELGWHICNIPGLYADSVVKTLPRFCNENIQNRKHILKQTHLYEKGPTGMLGLPLSPSTCRVTASPRVGAGSWVRRPTKHLPKSWRGARRRRLPNPQRLGLLSYILRFGEAGVGARGAPSLPNLRMWDRSHGAFGKPSGPNGERRRFGGESTGVGWANETRSLWNDRSRLESTPSYLGKWVPVLIPGVYGVMCHFLRYFGGSRWRIQLEGCSLLCDKCGGEQT